MRSAAAARGSRDGAWLQAVTGPRSQGWESLFWSSFHAAANAMVLLDPERVIIAINPASTRLFGYANSDVIGHRSDRFVSAGSRLRESHWASLLRTGSVKGARQSLHKDGSRLVVPFDATCEIIGGRQLILWVVPQKELTPQPSPDTERHAEELTARELEVIAGLASGKRVHEIARQLVISPSTAQTHVRNAMLKLGTRSQAQLVATVLATGMLDPRQLGRPR